MWKKVQEYIREYGLLEPEDRVIAAVSGGADSVCLLSVLCEIMRAGYSDRGAAADGSGIRLRAVHVHHGLRGLEADRDEAFVRKLCGTLKVPLTVVHRQVAEYARERGLSTEEAGRILRYEAFEAEAERWAAEEECSIKIAIAHHRDDSAETILYHLLRGSGLKGLSGIRPVQGSRIRPLLCVNRAEILDYLTERGLSWCEDSTNASGDYTRNRIRNQILPLLAETVNVRAEENILHAGEIFSQADRYLEQQADAIWKEAGSCMQRDSCGLALHTCDAAEIRLDAFLAQPEIIQTYLTRRMLDQVTPGWKDITFRHFRQIADLADSQTGSSNDLPCGMRAVRGYEVLRIERKSGNGVRKSVAVSVIPLPTPEGPEIQAGGLALRAFFRKKQGEIPKNQYTKWFDYDKIKDTLSVRYRQTGDYLTLPGGGKKAVTRYMIDEKIPRSLREQIPVLAERDHILWVVGYRISEYYKVTNTTRTILQVSDCEGTEQLRR